MCLVISVEVAGSGIPLSSSLSGCESLPRGDALFLPPLRLRGV